MLSPVMTSELLLFLLLLLHSTGRTLLLLATVGWTSGACRSTCLLSCWVWMNDVSMWVCKYVDWVVPIQIFCLWFLILDGGFFFVSFFLSIFTIADKMSVSKVRSCSRLLRVSMYVCPNLPNRNLLCWGGGGFMRLPCVGLAWLVGSPEASKVKSSQKLW